MKKYLAIGHWYDNKNATVSVALSCSNMKSFKQDLGGKWFCAVCDHQREKNGNT